MTMKSMCAKNKGTMYGRRSATVLSSGELQRLKGSITGPRSPAYPKPRDVESQEADVKSIVLASLTEEEMVEVAENEAIKQRAAHLLEEQKDEMKRMNQMMLYSQCVAVRDQQIKEKKQNARQEMERQEKMDTEMEAVRRAQLLAQEEAEKIRFEWRRAGMAVLEEQLQEQEELRAVQQAERLEEQVQIEATVQAYKARDSKLAEEKRAAAAALLGEVMAENALMIERKKQEKLQELEEDASILAYMCAQDSKAQALLEEKAQQLKAQELETARLRAQQERLLDQQAQRDELRAKRWQEAAARRERENAELAVAQAAAQQKAIVEARKAQAATKALTEAALAQADAAEYEAALRQAELGQKARQDQEVAIAARKKEHLSLLQAQVEEKEKIRLAQKALKAIEGRDIKLKLNAEMALIECVRQKKLQELMASGVPEKYLAQLARENFRSTKLRM